MCKYTDIETVELPNGKTVKEVNDAVRREVERIYLESWLQGVSVPFFDDEAAQKIREEEAAQIRTDVEERITGSDIDAAAVERAKKNAEHDAAKKLIEKLSK